MASNIRQVEKRFAETLAESLHQPGMISDLLRNIELKLFSQDHQWRDIAEALNHLSPAYDVYKRIALVKYLQYLGCRQDVLRSLYLDKIRAAAAQTEAPASAVPSTTAAATSTAKAAVSARAPELPVPFADEFVSESVVVRAPAAAADDDSQIVSMRDTAIFQVEHFTLEGDTEGFALLPRGETLDIKLEQNEPLEILLSNLRLKVYPGQRFRLTGEDGQVHILATGKNLIGRHGSCDVVVGGDNRTISRKHLMIEPISTTAVRITDLSSHGTSIPMHYLYPKS